MRVLSSTLQLPSFGGFVVVSSDGSKPRARQGHSLQFTDFCELGAAIFAHLASGYTITRLQRQVYKVNKNATFFPGSAGIPACLVLG